MGRIVILTGDRVFGRMLELELRAVGYEVLFDRGGSRNVRSAQTADPADDRQRRQLSVSSQNREHDRIYPASDNELLRTDVFIIDTDTHNTDFDACDVGNTVAVSFGEIRNDAFSKAAFRLIRPFETSELLRIISELTSNAVKTAEPTVTEPSGYLQIDTENQKASYHGTMLELTRREFELLACLYASKGTPISRSELIKRVWRYDFEGNTNVVDVYIRYLREKIDIPFGVKLIETVRGAGYRIV